MSTSLLYHTFGIRGGFEYVRTLLTKLEHLCLDSTHIGDAGLEHLKGMKNLKSISLYGTQVTDAGLKHLTGLTNLESLVLSNTRITDVRLKELKVSLPNVQIRR